MTDLFLKVLNLSFSASWVVLAVVFFMKHMADNTRLRVWTHDVEGRKKELPDRVSVVELDGPMFFASADKFAEIHGEDNTEVLILRMHDVPYLDATALKNLFILVEHCKMNGTTLIPCHVGEQPVSVLTRSGFLQKLGEEFLTGSIDDALEKAKACLKD